MLPTIAPLRPQNSTSAHLKSQRSQFGYTHLERVVTLSRVGTCRYQRMVDCRARGARYGGRGYGEMPADLDRLLPRWLSRASYIRSVEHLATLPEVAEVCRRQGVAVATWLAVTVNDAIDARDGGRIMSTSQAVAAARINRATKQVQRARKTSVELGIYIEVYRGRELSQVERIDLLRSRPGHKQRGLPSIYALNVFPPKIRRRITVPEAGHWARVYPQAVTADSSSVHLPSLGKVRFQSTFVDPTLLAANAPYPQEAAPPPAPKKRCKTREGVFFARSTLSQRCLQPLLTACTGTSTAAMLLPHSRGGWRPQDLAQALLDAAQHRNIHTWEPATSPHGLLKTLLTDIDIDARIHFTGRAFPADPPPPALPEPCGTPTCDGYGWLLDDNPQAPARPCPHCPPAIRSGHWIDAATPEANSSEGKAPTDPLF